MKKVLFILLSFVSVAVNATTYYVSISGNDSNNGTTTSTPWKTLQYAETHATAPGDIIALKKGDVWSTATVLAITHGGSSGNLITWDGSLWGTGANAIISSSGNRTDPNNAIVNFITSGCHYVAFKNITVDGNNTSCFGLVIGYIGMSSYSQNNEHDIIIDGCSILNIGNGSTYRIAFLCATWNNNISNITIQHCVLDGSDDEQLSFYCGRSDENATPANCNNVYIGYNTMTNWGRRGQSTGYGMQINNKTTNVIIEHNTLTTGPKGHGNAFQLESNEPKAGWFPTGVVFRYNKVTSSINNAWAGIIQGGQAMSADFYYNLFISTATGNGSASGGGFSGWVNYNVPYTGAVFNFSNNVFYTKSGNCIYNEMNTSGIMRLKNNIFFSEAPAGAAPALLDYFGNITTHSNNLYYRSAGANELKVQSNGTYYYNSTNVKGWETTAQVGDPLTTDAPGGNFHLLGGSPAIGAGISVPGILADYDGVTVKTPPSIGAFENGSGTPAPQPVLPVYQSSSVENATLSLLTMTYDQTLANIVPDPSAFSVLVNSAVRTTSAVTVSGTKVQLTMTAPVKFGDVITVAYTKPTTNPLQTTAGGQAASISAKAVTNNCASPVPVYTSSVVQNATPSKIDLTYNLALGNSIPAATAFAILINSVVTPVSTVTVSGTLVQLTLANPLKFGDVATVSYTKPASNPLQTSSGGVAASFTAQPVTNNLINPTKDVTPVTITMTVSPTHVHRTLNVSLAYSATPTAALSPEIVRIYNLNGKLFLDKLLTTGATNVKIPLNLRSGVYIVHVYSAGADATSKKFMVY
jgi:uncharacterized repeat protein (TIGR02059 family)